MADIVLINPRFEVSYWGLEHALPILGRRANMPVASLPLLAALTPGGHSVALLDENVEAIDLDRCARADIVGLTGMVVQRERMQQLLAELKKRGAFVVVGGPWATVKEEDFEGKADVIFVGEAEETWPRFLREWADGRHGDRYEQADRTDMTTVPTPRFDLLAMRHYLFGNIQISRGCPFQCEFCDIIVTFGRKPRLKTSAQVLAELDALRAQGVRGCFIVDDNLIGNKRAIRPVLRDIVAWQERHGYPLTLFTEASLDLAEEPELMALMVEANIVNVFVGIESPNEESLRETKKYQNVRPAGTLAERIRRIQDAGMEVMGGMILGFDHDDETVFDLQVELVREARIINVMLGMLSAIPKTPLHDRMAAEGRLDLENEAAFGTNIVPLRLGREQLREGFIRVLAELNEPTAYFDRLESLYLDGRMDFSRGANRHWRRHPIQRMRAKGPLLLMALVMLARLCLTVRDRPLRREYLRRIGRLVRARPDSSILWIAVVKAALQHHAHRMARSMVEGRTAVINTYS
ncbi:(Dimethylallyl)adenosine tRNA methylthiotransferase MiaB [Aquisphaera giovannonii]|uniref:(Dimethylallyl)adenosine tRNA methylthiotransferase MiaB n=1 Tax=Aquisphaera giovannonii TaxID=406548 RepID=A0A5B9WCN1_9BACT|nr:radical SAM protein [Aquisphaera giovannonii]QEH37815.1 (Dimethylallyl)adenosine tRNA methylthiotransferase MiaB [Aquisphaera giovannonii]